MFFYQFRNNPIIDSASFHLCTAIKTTDSLRLTVSCHILSSSFYYVLAGNENRSIQYLKLREFKIEATELFVREAIITDSQNRSSTLEGQTPSQRRRSRQQLESEEQELQQLQQQEQQQVEEEEEEEEEVLQDIEEQVEVEVEVDQSPIVNNNNNNNSNNNNSRPLKRVRFNMSSDSNNNNTNGTHPLTNGVGTADFLMNPDELITMSDVNGESTAFNKNELIRLLIQSLHYLGYKKSADFLEKDSGVNLQTPEVMQFINSTMEGDWKKVENLLPYLKIKSQNDLDSVKFLIYSQKFLELLEIKKVKEALECLRCEITPISKDPHKLQSLTSLIMCTDTLDLKKRSFWPGAGHLSRTKLLNDIRKFVSSEIMVPENRLEQLIMQAIQYQTTKCLYHNTTKSHYNLFEDHACNRNQMPLECKYTLAGKHRDEVWYLKFSNNGKKLASCSKDSQILIWDMSTLYEAVPQEPRVLATLSGHNKDVSYLSWSPDDRYLISASSDNSVKLWSVDEAVCLKTYSKHTDAVTCCAWHPDGKRFVSGGNDKNLYLWNIATPETTHQVSVPIRSWACARVNDMAIHRDGKQLIVICQEKKIRIFDIDAERPEISIAETEAIMSMALSQDSRYIIVNTSNQEIHLWDLEKRIIVQKYRGQRQGRFVIRSCFGGVDEGFILSGSEDSKIYIWRRQNGALLECLSGHTKTVNCVAWSPTDPYLFCSASDDETIRVWTRKELELSNSSNNDSVSNNNNNNNNNSASGNTCQLIF
ncbi:hypothetical protein PPL_06445 [Heterostelium album PN500]|uniref:CTLH domain-containing protein n=1 Tax=Heterostelium pallidum (strain ATCC 26659 / Pp 5 / PN500) TaxID=670386 RepID=D3BD64_HETP5|nr:hypothetical protein PPL_06445 [Heterostelium album PN500]EFA80856.1 hypothetical protein PPL_06445 [Heterostelium album PN500]|eukprot:XP_020432975.1 hypothetical protein PPL_06445 [Heterostelium album PN500]